MRWNLILYLQPRMPRYYSTFLTRKARHRLKLNKQQVFLQVFFQKYLAANATSTANKLVSLPIFSKSRQRSLHSRHNLQFSDCGMLLSLHRSRLYPDVENAS